MHLAWANRDMFNACEGARTFLAEKMTGQIDYWSSFWVVHGIYLEGQNFRGNEVMQEQIFVRINCRDFGQICEIHKN